MKNRKHKIGDIVATTDNGIVYTVGWITRINKDSYAIQWSDDAEEYPMLYNYNDIKNFREWYNTFVNKVDHG